MFAFMPLVATWACTSGDMRLDVHQNLTYTLSLSSKVWLERGDVALHFGGSPGEWLIASVGSLVVNAATQDSGVDPDLGAWVSLNVSWGGAPFRFETSFVCFEDADMIEFDARWPSGAPAGASPGGFYIDSSFYNFNMSSTPSAHFPSFRLGPEASASSLGHIQWAGEFAFHRSNFNVSFEGYVGGSLGGPVVLHEPSWSSGTKTRAGVLGPLSGFKDVPSFIVPDPADPSSNAWRFVVGPQGHIDSLPVNFSTRYAFVAPRSSAPYGRTAIFEGDTGITAAVYCYGATLRAIARTQRFAPEDDCGVSILSAWTDNGAALDGDYWDRSGNDGTGGSVFSSLREGFDAKQISIGSLQLDPWWFSRGNPGYKDWLPSTSIFNKTGWNETIAVFNTTLYSFLWAVDNDFDSFAFEVSAKWDNFMGGPFARVTPHDAENFYGALMSRCVSWGCIGFEIDFLDMQYAGFDDAISTPGLFEEFLAGLSEAGARAGVPIQLCMPLTSDVLASATLRGVSNIRASDDNDLSYASADRWRIGLTSLLHGSLDVRPFMDGVWTVSHVDGYDYSQNASELNVAISVLSTGPVGVGDSVGASNATLLRAAVASNGVILKPSLPAAPVDVYFRYEESPSPPLVLAKAELWAAPSFIPIRFMGARPPPSRGGLQRFRSSQRGVPQVGTFPNITACPFFSVLSVDAPSFRLFPTDLSPSLVLCSNASSYVSLRWSPGFAAMALRCANGAPALGCVSAFNDSGIDIETGAAAIPEQKGGPHSFEIFSLAPVLSGWALLGEVDKFTRVSPVRFSAVAAEGGTLVVWVDGAPNEVVHVSLVAPSSSGALVDAHIVVVDVAFNESGVSQIVCTGIGATAECAPTNI